jgi:hypothetical protein
MASAFLGWRQPQVRRREGLSRSFIKKRTGDQPWTRDLRLVVNIMGASVLTMMPGRPWFWRLLVPETVPLLPHQYFPPPLGSPLCLRFLSPNFYLRTPSHRHVDIPISPPARNNSRQSTLNGINIHTFLQDVPPTRSLPSVVDEWLAVSVGVRRLSNDMYGKSGCEETA